MNSAEKLAVLKVHTDSYFQMRSIADKYWSFHAAVALAIAGFILSSASVLAPGSPGHATWLKPISTIIIIVLGYTSYHHMSQTYSYYRSAHKSLVDWLKESNIMSISGLIEWPTLIEIRSENNIRYMHIFTTACLLTLLWLR